MGWRSVFRPNLFEAKVAIVSGGGTGIGLAITRELLELGCHVVICSRDQRKLDAAIAGLAPPLRAKASGRACNVRDEAACMEFVEHVVREKGKVDFLVNCAGGQFVAPAESLSSKGFKAVVETNLVGTWHMCRAAFVKSMEAHGGAIVNITMVTENGIPKMAHSSAARAGVTNLSRTLATEWAPAGVRINCVAPGIIYTKSGFANYGPMGQVLMEAVAPAMPFKRLGTAEEVSAATVFLLSEGASYSSGSTVYVDGGTSLVGYPYPMADTGSVCNFPVYGDESELPPAAICRAKL